MRLVDKPIARVIGHGFAREKLAQKKRTAGSINSSQARDNAVVRKDNLFGFAQNSSSFVSRSGRTRLIHDVSMLLGVNARAAGHKQEGTREGVHEVPRPL